MQVGTNHFGTVLLTESLLPLLAQSAPARVVVVSSALESACKALDWARPTVKLPFCPAALHAATAIH